MVWATIPTPGPEAVFTNKYLSDNVVPAGVIPNRPASCASGLKAINVPPAFTQLVSMVTFGAVNVISPKITTS